MSREHYAHSDSGGLLSSWCQVDLLPRKEEPCTVWTSPTLGIKKRQFPPELIAKTLQKIGNFDINS